MNAQQLAAMREGRERVRAKHRQMATERVDVYLKWLKSGSDLKRIPPIPSDADFRLARSA